LGYDAVESVEYDPRDAPDRESLTYRRLTPDLQPLPPQRVELYLNNQRGEEVLPPAEADGGEQGGGGARVFVASELCRQVVLGMRQADVQDYEIMTRWVPAGGACSAPAPRA
jgi:hypothetical protein